MCDLKDDTMYCYIINSETKQYEIDKDFTAGCMNHYLKLNSVNTSCQNDILLTVLKLDCTYNNSIFNAVILKKISTNTIHNFYICGELDIYYDDKIQSIICKSKENISFIKKI
jgi:hypothetical protein